jgi:hypothetical protein
MTDPIDKRWSSGLSRFANAVLSLGDLRPDSGNIFMIG